MTNGFYARRVLPHLVRFACRNLDELRVEVVPQARGQVLEIGMGAGYNLPFYDPERIKSVAGLDPSTELLASAEKRARRMRIPMHFYKASAEAIPAADQTFDTVVTTFTLCTIGDVSRALGEMHRVLRPEGLLLFLEHGLTLNPASRAWQDRLTPIWSKLGGGCHLNRDIPKLIRDSGFELVSNEHEYRRRPHWLYSIYRGVARVIDRV